MVDGRSLEIEKRGNMLLIILPWLVMAGIIAYQIFFPIPVVHLWAAIGIVLSLWGHPRRKTHLGRVVLGAGSGAFFAATISGFQHIPFNKIDVIIVTLPAP